MNKLSDHQRITDFLTAGLLSKQVRQMNSLESRLVMQNINKGSRVKYPTNFTQGTRG